MPKYSGIENEPLFFKPGANGKIDTARFRQLVAGDNITITSGANTDTISATGGGGGEDEDAYHTMTLAADSSYVTFNRPNGTKDTLRITGIYVVSYGLNGTSDSTVLLLSDGTRFAAPTGAGGGGTPAGNYGNIQINRNSTFATPVSDSLTYTTNGGFVVKNGITALSLTSSGTGGSNREFKLYSLSGANNFGVAAFYPPSGTDVGMSVTSSGKGIGFPQSGKDSIRAQMTVFNTDLGASPSSYSFAGLRATGVNGYGLMCGYGGSGIAYPIYIDATGGEKLTTANMVFNTNGRVGIGNSSASYKLDVTGDLRNTTDAYLSTASGLVGIGNTSPTYKLDVTGSLRATSTAYFGDDINLTTNGKGITLTGASSTQGYKMYTINGAANFAIGLFYPTAATNAGMSFTIAPKSTGLSSTIKAQLGIYNTDLVSDGSNTEYFLFRAAGTDGYLWGNGRSGTGSLRAMSIDATGGISPSAANIHFATDGRTLLGSTSSDGTNKLQVTGNIALKAAGNKILVATGSNASIGKSSAMTAGTITISTTAVTANSIIFLTHAGSNVTNAGVLSVGTITVGTSFVINSSNASDTDTVNWWIIN